MLYILDAGHGINTYIKGLNPYRKSDILQDGSQLFEYEFNRNVVSYLSFMLRKEGFNYHVLVDTENDMKLSDRVKKANEIANGKDSLFISIHGNWFKDKRVNGFETHYFNSGLEYAKIFQNYISLLGHDRGIKKSNLYVLKYTNMPAILTENGFYSNEIECKKMLTPEFQYKIAELHFEAIKQIEYIK